MKEKPQVSGFQWGVMCLPVYHHILKNEWIYVKTGKSKNDFCVSYSYTKPCQCKVERVLIKLHQKPQSYCIWLCNEAWHVCFNLSKVNNDKNSRRTAVTWIFWWKMRKSLNCTDIALYRVNEQKRNFLFDLFLLKSTHFLVTMIHR